MEFEEKFALVTRNLQEVIGKENLKELLSRKEKPVVYLGTAPTGRPHVGYFAWGIKVADLLKAGFHVKILIADLHAALDNTPWNILEHRYDYYAKIIPLMLEAMGAETRNLEFVKGSEIQLKPEYMYDVLQLSSLVSVHDSKKAGAEVVKASDNPKLSGLLYPLMQAIDEEYLKVDCQLGGVDQRKIMVLARENLPKLGYESRIELMIPLIPGLIGKKMSSSDMKSKIDLMDSSEEVLSKMKGADCVEGNPDNGIMAFLKYVLMVLKNDRGEKFVIERPEKYGGNLEYEDYASVEKDFVSKKIHPLDLKNSVSKEISLILKTVQKNREVLDEISKLAYPAD